MKKAKKVFVASVIAAILTGTAMIITGLSKGFGSKFVLDFTIIIFSASVFIVFLSYVLYKKEKRKEWLKSNKGMP